MAKHSSNVSEVHPDVSRDVSQTSAADPAPVRSRKRAAKQRRTGRYLVRAGAAFLFQLRVPTFWSCAVFRRWSDLASGRSRILRRAASPIFSARK